MPTRSCHDKSDIAALVSIYALIAQMRILSSLAVVGKAEGLFAPS